MSSNRRIIWHQCSTEDAIQEEVLLLISGASPLDILRMRKLRQIEDKLMASNADAIAASLAMMPFVAALSDTQRLVLLMSLAGLSNLEISEYNSLPEDHVAKMLDDLATELNTLVDNASKDKA